MLGCGQSPLRPVGFTDRAVLGRVVLRCSPPRDYRSGPSVVDPLAYAPIFFLAVLPARPSAHRQAGRYNIGALKTFAAEPQISACS